MIDELFVTCSERANNRDKITSIDNAIDNVRSRIVDSRNAIKKDLVQLEHLHKAKKTFINTEKELEIKIKEIAKNISLPS